MYLKKLLIAACIMFAAKGYSQNVAINADGSAPDNTAILDVQSTSKGILAPRMTEAQRLAISQPANGLLVYQTDGTPGFYFYSAPDVAWKILSTNSSTGTSKNAGTIIPFASGTPVTLTSVAGGLAGTVASLGFGSNTSSIPVPGGIIDLTGANGVALNNAFVVPRDMTITDLSATFSLTTALAMIGTDANVQALVYYCPPGGGNTFTPLPGATVVLAPSLSGVLAIGTFSSGTASGLNIQVSAGSRLLLVFSTTASGLSLVNTLTGYGSAGLRME